MITKFGIDLLVYFTGSGAAYAIAKDQKSRAASLEKHIEGRKLWFCIVVLCIDGY